MNMGASSGPERAADAVLAELTALSASGLSDALDRLGIAGQCAGISPVDRNTTIAGRAFTVRYGPVGQDPGTVGDYIDELGPGDVVVLDNRGRTDTTVWGDLLTLTASRRNVAGTVIDGVCRDTGRALTFGYPIFCRGSWMRTGKDRVRVEAMGEAVCVGGVRVEPGDYLAGDGDGIVVLPAGRAAEIVAVATEIETAEAQIRAAVESGMSLRDARAAMKYHQLQTRP